MRAATTTTPSEIYSAPRDETFRCFLFNVLSLAMSKNQIDKLLDPYGMHYYAKAFTHKSADPVNNYEFYEFMGDSIVNKAIVSYLPRRFKQLECPEGVVILSRLKIKLVSKTALASKAESLMFWEFISAETDIRKNRKNVLLEDTFEAFFGVTEKLVNEKFLDLIGYSFCYTIISKIMDTTYISLKYEDLFDSKTRLKELFDHFSSLGKFEYKSEVRNKVHYVNVVWKNKIVGSGQAALKINAEQLASSNALIFFSRSGYSKPIPEAFQRLCRQ